MERIDADPRDLETVRAIIRRFAPDQEVRVFGSRLLPEPEREAGATTGRRKAHKTSDLDLVLMTARPFPIARLADLREAFSESDLPFMVDVVDWASTSPAFRGIIERDYVVIQETATATASSHP